MEKKKNSKQFRIRCNLIGFIVLFIFLLLFRDFLAAAAIIAGAIYVFIRYKKRIFDFFRFYTGKFQDPELINDKGKFHSEK